MRCLFFNRRLARLILPLAFGLLAASAQAAQPCRVEPFGRESAADRARDMARPCGGEHLKWNLSATPRRAMLSGQPNVVRARLDSFTTRRFGPGMLATLKLNWAASGDSFARRFQTDRMALAAGGWFRFDRRLALQANIGREKTSAARTRATLATVWQPMREALLFAEWAGTEAGTEMHRVGARWWLLPRRLALDFGATARPDDGLGWEERRIGVTYGLLR
jgi:hypothetical protein